MKHQNKFFFFGAAALILFFGYTNCSPGFKSAMDDSLGKSGISDCFDDPASNACVMFKNPIAASGAPIKGGDDLDKLQTQSATIDQLDASGFLQNAQFAVYPMTGDRLKARDGNWKYRFSEDAGVSLSQVSAYVNAHRTITNIQTVAGSYYVPNAAPLKIITGADRTGYSTVDHAIFLAQAADGRGADLDSGLLVHFLGVAYLDTVTAGRIYDFTGDTAHVDCGTKDGALYLRDCCADKIGCSSALSIGQADYLAAISFIQSPAVGESRTGNVNGLVHCGISRDVTRNKTVTATSAYAACTADGRLGLTYPMGALYASIWWEVRDQARTAAGGVEMVDRAFFAHLPKLKGSDTFVSAFDAIIAADKEVNGGKLADLFRAEFTRRGLEVR